MSRIPDRVVAEVYHRANGYCEACGAEVYYPALHHRLPLSAGGENTAVNLMFVHGGITGGCHNLHQYSIHQNPARSYRVGHMVHRGTDPAMVPVSLVDMHLKA